MTRDAQSLKIDAWAESGDRTDPEGSVPPLERGQGWTLDYSQPGGPLVERFLFNQLLREVTGMCKEMNNGGSIPEWSAVVDYLHPAFVRYAGTLYISRYSTGPLSAIEEPGTGEGWREY